VPAFLSACILLVFGHRFNQLVSALCLFIFFATGCGGLKSRYAMDDPIYANKYAEGAERGDILGKAKQAIDARHVTGLSGWYLSGGALYRPKSDNSLAGADFGFENYIASWLSHRLGLGAYWSNSEGYIGADTGVRAQLPTRVTPFIGAGAMFGVSKTEIPADKDGADNDDDDLYDEPGETKSGIDDVLAVVYPELGVHAWLNSHWRLTGYGRYMLDYPGDETDGWLIGGQLTYLYRPK
jgi:hypothetical protein